MLHMSIMQWYYDVTTPGVLEEVASTDDDGSNSIGDGAALVILNEQDSVGEPVLTIFGSFIDQEQRNFVFVQTPVFYGIVLTQLTWYLELF